MKDYSGKYKEGAYIVRVKRLTEYAYMYSYLYLGLYIRDTLATPNDIRRWVEEGVWKPIKPLPTESDLEDT